MKTSALLIAAYALLAAASINASIPAFPHQNQSYMKGYLTAGRNVVILPERLQWGDKIVFFNIQGAKVFEEFVGNGFMAANLQKLPMGVYNLVVFRKNKIIAALRVPILGSMAERW